MSRIGKEGSRANHNQRPRFTINCSLWKPQATETKGMVIRAPSELGWLGLNPCRYSSADMPLDTYLNSDLWLIRSQFLACLRANDYPPPILVTANSVTMRA